MAQHFKAPKTMARGLIIALVAVGTSAALLVGCFAVFAVANSGVLHAIAGLFTETTETPSSSASATVPTTTAPPEPEPQYAVPAEMKGVWLTPGVDYLVSGKEDAVAVKKQINTAFAEIDAWGFNTVLLPLHRGEAAVYPTTAMECITLTDAEGGTFEPIAYALELARNKNLYVYGVLDMHIRDGEEWDPRKDGVIERTVSIAEEAASKYALDGVFVGGFAFALGDVKAEEHDATVTAINTLMSEVSQALIKGDRDRYVGLLSYGVWAHKSVNEKGSNTNTYYEELTDGCADTLGWLEKGLFHCVMVKNYASTVHPTSSFQKVLEWWSGKATELDMPLYMAHSAATVGSHLSGWSSPDQLAQQFLYSKDSAAWRGSAYESLSALKQDKLGAATALKKAYDGTLNEQFIYDQLKITMPGKTTYTTTESTVTFQGGGDTNFPLTINGETVELSEHGFFTKKHSLKIGLNTFNFSHKGKTATYKITYKQTLLNAVLPSENMTVDGGSKFLIRVTARQGSAVTAVINGVSVKLTATDGKEEESGNLPSDFQNYTGSYTLPKGKIGQEQNLGVIKVTATYNGLTETKNGGTVKVAALPVPPPTPPAAGTGEIVVITSQYAETFNGGDFIDDWSRPYNSYLPKGTQDNLVGKVYNGSLSYYLLGSGKRVYQKDAKVVSGALNANVILTGGSATVQGIHTVLSFDAGWNMPVYIAAYPQQYYNDIKDPSSSKAPNYSLERYGQTAEYVDVTFYYTEKVPDAPDLTGNPLFTTAKWIDNGNGVWTLRLTLKGKGKYFGHQLEWNGDSLKLSFLNPADISQNAPEEKLKGVSILIDPGHGSDDDKPWEGPFNLLYANELKAKLEALGATVTMTRDKDLGKNGLSLESRVAKTHAGNYHMMISVHMNGYDGTATGATAHYYDEVGYTLASYIYPKMHAVETQYGVGTNKNGRPRSSGTVWGTLYMNRCIFDCPSVLLECAFLDNPKDKEALINPVYRDKLMQAVTDGVMAYFEAM